jgi:transcriptional regulator
MHPNPAFRKADTARNLAFARERGFGILSINGEAAPLFAHVPFTLNEDGSIAALHLVRSNPILRALEAPAPAAIVVNGPDAYVSPDWYGVEDQVPTWNYVAVHLRGTLERRPDDVLPGLLAFQSYAFESRIKGKTPWSPDKMTPEVFGKMQRAIVPVRLHVEEVEGTWKLGQNKSPPVRHAASRKMKKGMGQEIAALSALMRRPDID